MIIRSQLIVLVVIRYVNLYQQSGSSNMTEWKLEVGVASSFIHNGKGLGLPWVWLVKIYILAACSGNLLIIWMTFIFVDFKSANYNCKIRLYISWEQTIHMKWQVLFSLKNNNNKIVCRLLQIFKGNIFSNDMFRHNQSLISQPQPYTSVHIRVDIKSFWRLNLLYCHISLNHWTGDSGHIMKTYLYNFEPVKPHFYIVKLGFTGVYIIFLISAQKHRLWVLVRTPSARRF